MSQKPNLVCLLEAALAYASKGFAVFPLIEGGKRPLSQHGVKDATTNPRIISDFWERWPKANIGLAVPAGFLVLDVDSAEALDRLRAEDLSLPSTVCSTTGRGRHLWYSTGELTIRNRVALFPGIDIRAPGGYVVVPPSVHPSGAIYRWDVRLQASAIAECPEWLLERLVAGPSRPSHSSTDWYRKIATTVPEGQRNQALAEVSGLLFRNLRADIAAELAYCWAQVKLRPPLSEAEVLRTINSIAGCELRRQEEQR